MKSPRIYIAGPINWMPNENIDEFLKAKAMISTALPDAKVIIPHELVKDIDTTNWKQEDYMAICIPEVCKATHIVTLADWFISDGTTEEVRIGRYLRKPVVHIVNLPQLVKKIQADEKVGV